MTQLLGLLPLAIGERFLPHRQCPAAGHGVIPQLFPLVGQQVMAAAEFRLTTLDLGLLGVQPLDPRFKFGVQLSRGGLLGVQLRFAVVEHRLAQPLAADRRIGFGEMGQTRFSRRRDRPLDRRFGPRERKIAQPQLVAQRHLGLGPDAAVDLDRNRVGAHGDARRLRAVVLDQNRVKRPDRIVVQSDRTTHAAADGVAIAGQLQPPGRSVAAGDAELDHRGGAGGRLVPGADVVDAAGQ